MKKSVYYTLFGVLAIFLMAFTYQNQPWKESQLMEPEELAKILNGPASKHPVIYNMGTMPPIKGAQMVGIGSTPHGMNKLKEYAAKLDKNKTVVLYCGCCTMENCPNIREPMEYLNSQGFKNAKVLHVKTDLSTDWINKGFPMLN